METKQQPYRIAIDARLYRRETAGVGRYTRALISELQKLDTTNQYTVMLTPADYKEWPRDGVPANWQTKVLAIPIYSKAEQTDFLTYLNKESFDLVHFLMFNHPVRYRRPFVVTIHDLTMTLFPNRPLWHPRTWAYRSVMGHAARTTNQIIVPSQFVKNDLLRYYHIPEKKITVTLEAVEPEFHPVADEAKKQAVAQKYGITKPLILFVNAWRPHKGILDLLAAFREVKKSHDVQLLMSGKPNPSFPQVINAVDAVKKQTDDLLTPGFLPDEDLVVLYSLAETFVFPSHYEGFGLGALEAIACGCPTIAANNSSLPEALGDAALFYPTGDTQALAKTIIKLLDSADLRQGLRQKGLEQAQKFSFARMAQETLAVYEQILTHKQ